MKLLFIALLVLANTQWITSYQAFQSDEFDSLGWYIQNQHQGWVIQNQFEATTDIITKCSGKNIIGGLKTFGTKSTATKLIKIPPHYKLKFNLQLWKIGEWENDVFSVYVDGVPWEMKWGFTEGGIRLCGGQESKNSDKVFDVEFDILHNSPTVTTVLATTSQGKADVQAWGFRQMKISFIPCPSECGICHNDKVQECKHWNQEALSWFHVDTKLEGWKLENGKPKGYECSGIVVFGGYENIGAKALLSNTFTNMVPHSKVMVKFTFWKIDLWDNEQFYVKIDDKQVQKLAFQKTDGIDLCGAQQTNPGYGEKIVSIEIIQKHSSPSLTIQFTTSLKNDPDEQSWGVRDFFLFAAQCTKFCDECIGTAENECTKCQPTHTLLDGKCVNKNEWYILSKEFFTPEQFNKVDGWTFQDVDPAGPNPPFTKCGDLGLVGGYLAFGKKTTVQKVFNLPKHDFIRIRATVYKIDQWDGEELTMYVDNQEFWSQFLGWNDPGQSDICGNLNGNWKERIMNIDKIIPHSQSELTLDFKSTLQKTADEASWGFREFLLLYSPLKECIEVFSECNYQGKSQKVCDNLESLKDSQIDFDIKSIKIPEGLKITGFKNPGFKGNRVEYETNQECIDKIEFSLIQKQLTGNLKYLNK
ncbi:unnamed protein product (macronuclear) [Paramecium tetraurelia]|uniref:Uncharacterized protein n=1 Tax=Paramecium tetraurelia TaxID=5888 RepID=A0BRD3_PARTE|nr:uncharacterized protein GSPATT00031331001 [Paramecium tetraurelia]CAK61100.1 unnamed protein product [Paramecium tetraurelia]|eukprot:XP_001428498.1 hypothetical protein (macronuclear) [Paramecium tetraurelia strain d4-2]